MKYLFVIQGEGRGHLTQALSLKSLLEQQGHEVSAVLVGGGLRRELPAFFLDKIGLDVEDFQSPGFYLTAGNRKSSLLKSILAGMVLLPVYLRSLWLIQKRIAELQPDVVVNFYDILCGLVYGIFRPSAPMVCIAHQYYFLTPEFRYTGNKLFQFRLLNTFSRLTALRAHKMLALSFHIQYQSYYGKIAIVPPLLRNEVLNAQPVNGDYIHGYMLNSGFADELKAWSLLHPNQELSVFWNKKEASAVTSVHPGFKLYALNDSLFVEKMAGCKAYITTGGFESVCEAMYLQKPVLMIPTHIEQECNVLDAEKAGAGRGASTFDPGLLLAYLPYHQPSKEFRYWVQTAPSLFIYELSNFENYSPYGLAWG